VPRVVNRAAVGAAALAALIAVWGTRFNLNPDGISYLDMARHVVEGSPGQLISGYWSPGYPVLLLPVVALLHGQWSGLIPALHLINLGLFMVGLWLALRLAASLSCHRLCGPGWTPVLVTCAYAVIALQGIGLGMLTPDFAVLVAVLATAWCCMALPTAARWRGPIGLGLILGAGYWIKGILLPVDLVLVGLLLIRARGDRPLQRRVLLAGVVFALTVLPLVVMVSRRVGHASIGEVGKLNYAWEVDGVLPFIGWEGDSTPSHGRPVHPPRMIDTTVDAVEFATPIRGSYPLWYDPAYWYAGVRTHLDRSGQSAAFIRGVAGIVAVAAEYWAVLLAVAVLAAASRRAPAADAGVLRAKSDVAALLIVWCGLATLIYALIHVEPRYLAGFALVPSVVALHHFATVASTRSRWAVIIAIVALVTSLVRSIAANTGGYEPTYRPGYFAVADTIRAAGIPSGAAVAVIGDAFEQYGVVISGTHVTAQVLDSSSYWNRTAPARDSVDIRLASTGAVALLANNVADSLRSRGWRLVPLPDGGNVGVRRLEHPDQVAQRLGAQ
jgi:hypothetical protein